VVTEWRRSRPSNVIGFTIMEEQAAADTESESAGNRVEDQYAREREALRRRVRESLLRCPGAETSQPS
jgi:hypothetical protein